MRVDGWKTIHFSDMELSARDGATTGLTSVGRGLWYCIRINKIWLTEHINSGWEKSSHC